MGECDQPISETTHKQPDHTNQSDIFQRAQCSLEQKERELAGYIGQQNDRDEEEARPEKNWHSLHAVGRAHPNSSLRDTRHKAKLRDPQSYFDEIEAVSHSSGFVEDGDASVAELCRRLGEMLPRVTVQHEIIPVNDGGDLRTLFALADSATTVLPLNQEALFDLNSVNSFDSLSSRRYQELIAALD